MLSLNITAQRHREGLIKNKNGVYNLPFLLHFVYSSIFFIRSDVIAAVARTRLPHAERRALCFKLIFFPVHCASLISVRIVWKLLTVLGLWQLRSMIVKNEVNLISVTQKLVQKTCPNERFEWHLTCADVPPAKKPFVAVSCLFLEPYDGAFA